MNSLGISSGMPLIGPDIRDILSCASLLDIKVVLKSNPVLYLVVHAGRF